MLKFLREEKKLVVAPKLLYKNVRYIKQRTT